MKGAKCERCNGELLFTTSNSNKSCPYCGYQKNSSLNISSVPKPILKNSILAPRESISNVTEGYKVGKGYDTKKIKMHRGNFKLINLKIIGGDLEAGNWTCKVYVESGSMSFSKSAFSKSVDVHTASVDLVTEENKGKILRTAGWGVLGFAALGPIGAIAAMLGTKTKTEACVSIIAKDGKKVLATTDLDSFKILFATTLSNN